LTNTISLPHKAITYTHFLLTITNSKQAIYTPTRTRREKKEFPNTFQRTRVPLIVKEMTKREK